MALHTESEREIYKALVKVRFSINKKRTIPHHHDVTSQWIENFTRRRWVLSKGENKIFLHFELGARRRIKSLKFYCEIYCYLTKESFSPRLSTAYVKCVRKKVKLCGLWVFLPSFPQFHWKIHKLLMKLKSALENATKWKFSPHSSFLKLKAKSSKIC